MWDLPSLRLKIEVSLMAQGRNKKEALSAYQMVCSPLSSLWLSPELHLPQVLSPWLLEEPSIFGLVQ